MTVASSWDPGLPGGPKNRLTNMIAVAHLGNTIIVLTSPKAPAAAGG